MVTNTKFYVQMPKITQTGTPLFYLSRKTNIGTLRAINPAALAFHKDRDAIQPILFVLHCLKRLEVPCFRLPSPVRLQKVDQGSAIIKQ
jgi:hypothetical protein